ncbi:MAG: hypothetical protein CL912_30705 [Deltaproteobacteria bacterium]|nr:hypothetical protein [Deltaproteobacteria bacterium]
MAILYFEKFVVFMFINIGRPLHHWRSVPGVTNTYRDHLQATPMQAWRTTGDDVLLHTIDPHNHQGPQPGPITEAPTINGHTPHQQVVQMV